MKEKINKKLEEIRNQKEQVVANLNALSGAEQVLLQLLAEVQEGVEEVAE